MTETVQTVLTNLADTRKAKILQGYFKTGKGEYGEGDMFLGITVPQQRLVAKQFKDITLSEVEKLLKSTIHEYRFTALEILICKYETAEEKEQKQIVAFYLKNRKHVNNWDLVDTSAPYILGDWLLSRDKAILYKLVSSKGLWDRRIAIITTYGFIRKGHFTDTLALAEMLLNDPHDLIHKAVGWMLREVGKKSLKVEEEFLRKHHAHMPRTSLRYAIEKFPPDKRKHYLKR